MLLAYLRGLLRPDYKQGFRSRVREECILTAIDKEQRAAYNADLIELDTSMLARMSHNGVKAQYKRLSEALLKVANLREFVDVEPSKGNLSSVDASLKLFHALEKAGIVT